MAVLTVAQIVITKVAQTLAAANGGGDSFPNTGKELIAIKNAGGGSINLTVVASGQVCNYGSGSPTHDAVIAIPNDSVIYLVGPFATLRFNDTNQRAQLTYSGVTSVTIAIFSLPPNA